MTQVKRGAVGLLGAVLMAGTTLAAQDWPQFLGPARDGVYTGPALSTSWPADGPTVLWEREVGAGFAGPVVVGNRLVLFHRLGGDEVVEGINIANGATVWTHRYPTTYRDDFGFDEGPRSVPVVDDGVVYTFGAQGQLHAVDLTTGAERWSVDTHERYQVRKGFFGAAGSPLVADDRVIANVGGQLGGIVAFDAETGNELWTATADEASYSSPAGATFDGESYALFFTRTGLVGLDPASGVVRFEKRWRSRLGASVNAAPPLVQGNRIFISSSYGTGAVLVRVEGGDLVDEWTGDESMTNHYATAVRRDGVLYGFHGRQEYGPALRAVDFDSGDVLWSEERYGAGSIMLAGEHLVIMRESGELVLASASPDAFQPLATAGILRGVVRAYPALADGRLYVRSTNTLIAVDLR